MEKKNNKLFVIIAVCLVAVAVILSVFLLRGCGEENNESNTDVSVNIEISETVSNTDISTEISTEISTDEVSAEESTPEESLPVDHTHEYADTWSSNETDHWHECECGDKSDIANHTFGEWETTKEATEDATGSKKHTCSVCGYEETATIPMLSHTHGYSKEWASNETDHWYECACGDKSGVTSHTYGDWTVTKESTEETEGSKYHTCSGCGYKETVVIPVLAHTHKYADKWSNNETDHWKECKCGDKSGVANHNYGNWTTTKEATEDAEGSKYHTCNTCGYKETVKIPVLSHTHSFGGWKNNDTSHWKECRCGEKSVFSSHTYGAWTTTKEATCTATGIKKHTCTACGYSETATIPVIAHTYGDWKTNATSHWKECKCGEKSQLSSHTYGAWTTTKDATCTETGTKKHTCTACNYSETATIPVIAHTYGEWKTNATSHWKECKCGDKAQLSTHTYGDWETTKEATCTATGTKKHTCTACGYTETATIPVIAHTYGAWKSNATSHWKECKCGNVAEKANHTYTSVVTDPTETEQGYTTHTCNKCGYSYVDSYVDPIITSYSEGLSYRVNEDGVTCTIAGIGTCKDTNLKIPPEIDGYKVTAIGQRAFYGRTINDVVIPNGVTTIEYGAFSDCTRLIRVTISDSVTTIDVEAFEGCFNLVKVTIPDSVTTIGSKAFSDCIALTNVTIGNGITTIGENAFYGCTNLIYNTYDNACYLGNSKNPYLVLVKAKNDFITNCQVHSNTRIILDEAFFKCYELTSVTIGNSVKTIGSAAFIYCNGLTNIVIPDSVTTIGSKAFCECESLTSVTIGNGITMISDEMFEKCESLTSIIIPDSVTTIGRGAFFYCFSLTDIVMPDSVTMVSTIAFYGCNKLNYNTYDNACYLGNSSNPYAVLVKPKNDNITNCIIHPDTKTIVVYAFSNCKSLTSVTIGNGVTTIGEYAFSGAGLTSVIIPDSVTTIGEYAFESTGLISIIIPDSVKTIGVHAFFRCSKLTNVTIGNGVTTIGEYAFYECTDLTDVTMGTAVTTIGNSAFSRCESLTSVTIGNSVKTIDSCAFRYCNSLTSVTIPDSVTEIGSCAFEDCTKLTSVTFKDTSGWYVTESEGASSGTTVDVSDTATAAKYLGETYDEYYWWYKK